MAVFDHAFGICILDENYYDIALFNRCGDGERRTRSFISAPFQMRDLPGLPCSRHTPHVFFADNDGRGNSSVHRGAVRFQHGYKCLCRHDLRLSGLTRFLEHMASYAG